MKIVKSLGTAAALAFVALVGAIAMQAPAQAQTIIGHEYQHANYGGAILTVNVPSNGFSCTGTTGDVDASISSMPGGWDNVVSSFRNYSNCWTNHYEHANFGGASTGYLDDRSSMGAMNDQTSSIRWS